MSLLFSLQLSRSESADRRRKKRLFSEVWRVSQDHIRSGRPQIAVFAHDFVSHKINIDGVFEERELGAVFGWLHGLKADVFGGVALDIGANVGNHSIYFSRFFRQVECFEANPRAFALLSINVHSCANVRCRLMGLSNCEANAYVNETIGNLGHSSVVMSSPDRNVLQIQLHRLDDIWANGDRVTFMKVDVEGHESAVFEGASRLIGRDKPIIMFEQLGEEFANGVAPAIESLKQLGYRRFATVDVRSAGWSPKTAFAARFSVVVNRLIPWKSRVFGEKCELRLRSTFPIRDYPCIVAVPEWLHLDADVHRL